MFLDGGLLLFFQFPEFFHLMITEVDFFFADFQFLVIASLPSPSSLFPF